MLHNHRTFLHYQYWLGGCSCHLNHCSSAIRATAVQGLHVPDFISYLSVREGHLHVSWVCCLILFGSAQASLAFESCLINKIALRLEIKPWHPQPSTWFLFSWKAFTCSVGVDYRQAARHMLMYIAQKQTYFD